MKIFALADLHLSLATDKPMDIFGDNWNNHAEKIKDNWCSIVGDDDVVMVAGDISWALRINEAGDDLEFVKSLPGKKILLKGNHDYWWAGLKKVREATGEGFEIIQNNSAVINGVGFCGSRLWNYPFVKWPFSGGKAAEEQLEAGKEEKVFCANNKHGDVDDEKICQSELNRLENSLRSLPEGLDLKICMTHFPPVSAFPESNQLTEIIASYDIAYTVYGHLHALDRGNPFPGADCAVTGVQYILSSCDWLDFKPRLIVEV